MARRASFSLDRRMLVSKRSLLIDVALDAGCICAGRQRIGAGDISSGRVRVRRVTVCTANVVAPVLSTTEVVALFFARVARQTSLGCFLRAFVLERNDLGRIAFGNMILAGTVTGFASRYLVFPTANLVKLSIRGMGFVFELYF